MTDTLDTTATDTTPPEVLGEEPLKLTPEEQATLTRFRSQSTRVVQEIGNLEVHKARLLGSLSSFEEQAQKILQIAGTRLGIEEGQAWSVNPDGTIVLMPQA